MRAGPLSNDKIISLLNGHFVPVYVVNEDYAEHGPAPDEEKQERLRIFRQGHEAGLSVGTVHVYVLHPDGQLMDSRHVAQAAKPDELIALLETTVAELKVPEGEAVAPIVPQSTAPDCEPDSLVLHLVARSLDGRGAWSGFPVEDWIVLSAKERRGFVAGAGAGAGAALGDAWIVPAELAQKILTHFYPPTENTDASTDRIEEQELGATVVEVNEGVIRARIEGRLRMRHNFYHSDDGNVVEATVVGFIDFEPDAGLVSVRMVTGKATYNNGSFGVAVRSVTH